MSRQDEEVARLQAANTELSAKKAKLASAEDDLRQAEAQRKGAEEVSPEQLEQLNKKVAEANEKVVRLKWEVAESKWEVEDAGSKRTSRLESLQKEIDYWRNACVTLSGQHSATFLLWTFVHCLAQPERLGTICFSN